MKFTVLTTFLIVFILSSCSIIKVPAGNVGVQVDLWGQNKGVNGVVLTTGQYNVPVGVDVYLYPTFIQQYPFTKDASEGSPVDEAIYFNTKEGTPTDVDIGFQGQANPEKVPLLFSTFREEFSDIVKKQVRTTIRDSFNEHGTEYTTAELYGAYKIKLLSEVAEDVKRVYVPLGIDKISLSYLSKIRFPQAIEESINNKVLVEQQTLSSQNKVIQAKADADVQIARARGEAESNAIIARSLSPEVLKLKELQNQQEFIKIMSEGKVTLPTTLVSSSGANTFLPLK